MYTIFLAVGFSLFTVTEFLYGVLLYPPNPPKKRKKKLTIKKRKRTKKKKKKQKRRTEFVASQNKRHSCVSTGDPINIMCVQAFIYLFVMNGLFKRLLGFLRNDAIKNIRSLTNHVSAGSVAIELSAGKERAGRGEVVMRNFMIIYGKYSLQLRNYLGV